MLLSTNDVDLHINAYTHTHIRARTHTHLRFKALIGHNEDNDPINLYTSFMVHARITDIDPKTKKILTDEFLAFCYAGSLCGKAFGINFTKGTITTVNAVFPKDIVTTYLGACGVRLGLFWLIITTTKPPYSEPLKD